MFSVLCIVGRLGGAAVILSGGHGFEFHRDRYHSRPHTPCRLSQPAQETKGSGDGFLALDSRTDGLRVCSCDVWESHGVFYFRSRFFFKRPIKKIRINPKIPCPQSPSFLVINWCPRRTKWIWCIYLIKNETL